MKMKKEITSQDWAAEISGFYKFLEDGQLFLNHGNADYELIDQISAMVEIEKVNSDGNSYKEAKFDSAIYRDIKQIATLKSFLDNYSIEEIKKYHKLILIEISGLEGDLNPRSILTSTMPAAIITGLSLAAVWGAIGATYFGIDLFEFTVEAIVNRVKDIQWLRIILSGIFVIGGFVGIAWFITILYKNQKQVQYLKSLERVIALKTFINEMKE